MIKRVNLFFSSFFILYILMGLAAITISLVYNFNRESIGFAILLGPVIAYLLLKRRKHFSFNTDIDFKHYYYKFSIILFSVLIVLALLIFANYQKNYYLPLQYFIVISTISSVIFYQILFFKLSKLKTYLILSELFIFSILLSYCFIFLFSSPIGNDSAYHIAFINHILNSGSIDNFSGNYVNYPIFHLIFVSFIDIVGIRDLKVAQLFLAVVQVFFSIFIFLLSKRLFNTKIGLISVLLVSVIPYSIQPHYSFYPMAFTVSFFMLSLYLFTRISANNVYTFLFILLFVLLVFSHPLTPLLVIVITAAMIIISNVMQLRKKYLTIYGISLMLVLLISWWMQPFPFNNDIFTSFVLSIQNALTADSINVESVTSSPLYSFKDMFLYDLGFIILTFLSIIGSFYGIKNHYVDKVASEIQAQSDERLIFFIVPLLLIPVPYLLAIVYSQSYPDRWFPFIGIFLCISASYTLFVIKKLLNKKIMNFVPIILIFLIVFLNVSSPIANINNHVYDTPFSVRTILIDSEVSAVNFTTSYSNLTNIKANSKFLAMAYYNVKYGNYVNPEKPSTYSNGTVIIRNYDLMKGFTLPGYKGSLSKTMYPTTKFEDFLNSSDQVYNNGDLRMYYTGDQK